MTTFEDKMIENRNITTLVRRWGGLTTDALLDPRCEYFQIPHIEGFIGYRIERGCAVVFGDPVCAPSDSIKLARAFHDYSKGQCHNVIYLTASEAFMKSATQGICKAFIEYGEEVFLDPHDNPKERQGTHASLVRRKMRHAQKNGVNVIEYFSSDPIIEKELEDVGSKWLNSRKGPQIHISNIHLFDHREGKRWFYAQKEGQIVGVVVLNQLQSRQGWHMNHLMFTPEAPNGTPELLVVNAIEVLKSEDCSFVSFGFTPDDTLGKINGLPRISTWLSRKAYQLACKIFHLQGHKMFWGKFHPQTKPSYLLFKKPTLGVRELLALMRAMNASV